MSILRFSILIACLMLTGCGGQKIDYAKLNLAEVTGTVTLDGEPLSHAKVVFEGEPGKAESIGYTDDSGHYQLTLNSRKTGVLPGKKVVRITHGSQDDESEDSSSSKPSKPIKLPVRYNKKSELTAQIEASETKVIDFQLTSK